MMPDAANSTELPSLADHQETPSSSIPTLPKSLATPRRWREMITAALIVVDFFFLYSSISLMGVFFPAEAGHKGASVFVTGVIIGTAPLIVTVLAPIIGYLLPILKLSFSMVAGLSLVGIVYIGLGLSIYLPSGWPFIAVCIVLRIIEGVATALFTTAGYTLITQLYPDSTGFIGITEVGAGVGYASGPVTGSLLYKAGGYKLPFFVVGGLSLFLAIPISFVLMVMKSSRGTSTRQLLQLETVLNLLKNFIIMLLVLGVILHMAGLGFANTTYSLFLKEQFGLTPDKIGLVFLASTVSYAISAPLAGKLADTINPRVLVICGLSLSGLGYLIIGPTSILPIKPTLWLTICGDFMVGVGTGTAVVSTYTDVLIVITSQRPSSGSEQEKIFGIIAGMISAGMSFGEFLGPVIGGGLVDLTGFRTSASIVGELILALTTLLLMITLIDHCFDKRTKQETEFNTSNSTSRSKSDE